MSKKIKKTRAPKSKMQAKPVHDDGIGPFRVTVTVFGCYTHGNLAGKTNPKAFARMTLHGDTFKQAIGKIAMTGAFYRIEEVVDEGKQAIQLHEVEEPPEFDLLTIAGQAIAPIVNEVIVPAVKKRAVRKTKKAFELSEPLVTEGEL